MKTVVFVGGGDLAEKILGCIMRLVHRGEPWQVKGFIDDNPKASIGEDYPYLGAMGTYVAQPGETFVMAIANPGVKEKIAGGLIERGAVFETVVGPETILAEDVSIGAGSVIMTPCYIETGASIGKFVTIMGSMVSVDSVIGDYCTTTGFVNLDSGSRLGKGVYVGSHVVVCPGIQVGDRAHIGVGSIVVSHVGPGLQVFGYPARAYLKKEST